MNKIKSRFFIEKKQNANQSIKAETYASVKRTITKMTKNKSKKNFVKKRTTTNMMIAKKQKKLIIKVKNEKKNLIQNDIRR